MNTLRKLLAGATFLVTSVTVAPKPAFAVEEEQTVVCTTTTIRTSITEINRETGAITVREVLSVETTCVAIAN